MSVDVHDYTARDPRCKCRQVHGNADDDGICSFCRPKVEAAHETRQEPIRAAFARLAEQAPCMYDDDLEQLAAAALRAVYPHDRCRLCRCFYNCAPGCAAPMLRGLLE